MNLKHICMATSIMAAVGILQGCGSTTKIEDLQHYITYNTLRTKPTIENLEQLLIYVKDKNELNTLMEAYQLVWNLVRVQNATVQKQKELQLLYDTGKNWISNIGLDTRDLGTWLKIENDAEARNIIISPTSTAIINSAFKLTNIRFNELYTSGNSNVRTVSIRQIMEIKAEYNLACGISKPYPELKTTMQTMTSNLKLLSTSRSLQYHRECFRMCTNEELDPDLYKKTYLDPLATAECPTP